MKTKVFITTIALVMSLLSNSQSNVKQNDITAIKSMCGCYEVQFNFAETFNYAKDSLSYKPSQTKHEKALEWVQLIEDTPNKVSMQHLLIIGINEDDIVKHWRQDWIFENTDFLNFQKDLTWKYLTTPAKNVKGQWTQKVYQVDDSPRYEGSSSWVHVDGNHYWKNTTDAPLPRREHTKRNDYNVLKRRNIHEITASGWVHEQDNDKLIRNLDQKDILLAQEKGFDVYTKVPDANCKVAQNWWKKNEEIWFKIRNKWNSVYDAKKDISLHKKVEKKSLYSLLFDLKPTANQAEIDAIIDSFLIKS